MRVAMLLISSLAAAATAPATTTSKQMFAWYCQDHAETLVCKHHAIIQKIIQEKEPAAKKALQSQLTSLNSGSPSTLHKKVSEGYAEMKLAFCATNPPAAKSLCSTAATQYKTRGASPSSANSAGVSSHTSVMSWYCAKPNAAAEEACKRHTIMMKMRAPGLAPEERKALVEQLKLAPVTYTTTQAIYADFCKLPENAEKSTCSRLKTTAAAKSMRAWYCSQPGKEATSNWCQRSALLEKLQKIPSAGTDAAQTEERKKLVAEYQAFSKRPEGGGSSRTTLATKELFEAKKVYCALEANKSSGRE